jgi:hypothetical protein
MRNRNIAALAAGLVCGALMGCLNEKVAGGTGIGNPGNTEFAVVAASGPVLAKTGDGTVRNPDSSFSVTDAGGTQFTIRKAFANVSNVRIRLPDGSGCEGTSEVTCESGDIRLPGPFVSDLMTGASTPELKSFVAPAGAYRRVELRLEPLSPAAATPEPALGGHTIFISGIFEYSGKTARAFTIALDFDEETRVESGQGMTVLDSGVTRMLVRLKVDTWLAHSNITSCLADHSLALDSAGNLAIDKDHTCGNLEQSLRDGIKGSCDLGDEHHSGGSSGPH